jgi:CheY-like chemotaxis protein
MEMQMKPCILVVDDEKEIRDLLDRHFRFSGYEVLQAENGKDALVTMADHRVHVVISDIQMPVMNGVDLIRQVREHYPMVRIIMMTGYVTLENVLACWRRGADTCVFKPFTDLAELEEAVAKAVAAQQNWLRILNELRKANPARQEDEA